MNYFEARRHHDVLLRFRQLTLEYWSAIEPVQTSWMAGVGQPLHKETEKSTSLRQQIRRLLPEVQLAAGKLGVGVQGASYPAPIVGGPVIPVNFLDCVVDRRAGHHVIEPERIIDVIETAIGTAEFAKRRLLGRLLKPWCWLIDVPALIVGWPFAIMRKAGVPQNIIESTGAQILKSIMAGLLWLAAFTYAVVKTGLAEAITAALN